MELFPVHSFPLTSPIDPLKGCVYDLIVVSTYAVIITADAEIVVVPCHSCRETFPDLFHR